MRPRVLNSRTPEFKKFLADVKPSDFDKYDRSHGGSSRPEDSKGPADDEDNGKKP